MKDNAQQNPAKILKSAAFQNNNRQNAKLRTNQGNAGLHIP